MKPLPFVILWLSGLIAGLLIGVPLGQRHPLPVVKESLTSDAPATRQEAALLWAIAQVESGGNRYAISSDNNHFGAYQMSTDYILAFDGDQDQAALKLLRQLEQGRPFSASTLARQWRGREDVEYVARVCNLYAERMKQ